MRFPLQFAPGGWRAVLVIGMAAMAGGVVATRAYRPTTWPGQVLPYQGQAATPAEPTTPNASSWASRWDPEVGLWWQHHPGHTRRVSRLQHVHPSPSAAARLVLAAQSGRLANIDTGAVLTAIRRMQVTDGSSRHGCIRWYWEEAWPEDQNASFFAGLSLIALERCYRDQISDDQHETLLEILTDLRAFFVEESHERNFHYPNRCLGELVGAWLTSEILAGSDGEPDPDGSLRAVMLDAADYWDEQGWGWGEHMSDTYASVLLDEFSALLLMSRKLPDDVRERYKKLFDGVLAIDDAFGGKPRVPAVRSYAFTEAPTHTRYRDWVCPLDGDAAIPARHSPVMPPELGDVFQHRPPLGATFHALGWHDLAPAASDSPGRDVRVACFGGTFATARLEPDARLGSLSRFPLMPNADSVTWGNSWQSFPVALWRPSGEWAFLQWESASGQRVRAHPALDMMTAYHDNALAPAQAPLTVGQTYAIQRGGDVIALRVMPAPPPGWDRLTDRFRHVGAASVVERAPAAAAGGRSRSLLIRYPQRQVGVHCFPITEGATVARSSPASSANGRPITDWGVSYDRAALARTRAVAVLWGLSLDGPIDAPPTIIPLPAPAAAGKIVEDQPMEIRWEWPKTTWHLKVDPRGAIPLQEMTPSPALAQAQTPAAR